MYPSMNPNQVAYLKDRDVNTINRLYSGYNESQSIAQAPAASGTFNSAPPASEGYGDAGRGYSGGRSGFAPQYSSAPSPYYANSGPCGYSSRYRRRGFDGYAGSYGAPGYGGNMLTLGQREAIRQLARQAAMQRLQQQYQRGW